MYPDVRQVSKRSVTVKAQESTGGADLLNAARTTMAVLLIGDHIPITASCATTRTRLGRGTTASLVEAYPCMIRILLQTRPKRFVASGMIDTLMCDGLQKSRGAVPNHR